MRHEPATGNTRHSPPTLDVGRQRVAAMPRSPAEALEPGRPPRPPRRIRERREPRRMGGLVRFVSGLLTFSFLTLSIAAVVALVLRIAFEQPGPLAHTTVTVIPKGEGVYEIASRLEREGIVADRRLFVAQYLTSRLHAGATGAKLPQLKAGEYEVKKHASLSEVLETLAEGKAVLYKITVPEGLTSEQIVERLKAETNLVGEVREIPPEGTLLPDTYRFSRGMARQELLERMQADQRRFIANLWEKRQKDLPYQSIEQAMVLASIVEKETGRADERERVAAVFVNRMRKRMRLQSDPTIIYGIVGGKGPLGRAITRADIDARTPYNTYQIDGLPPTPICNPGRSAIQATLNPARTQDIYFVANGNGGHTFTANLKDHNAAVQAWRRIEREARARAMATAQGAPGAASAPGRVAGDVESVERPTEAEPVAGSGPVAPGDAERAEPAAASEPDMPLPIRKPRR